jgi:3-oxoacyl-[acyl-carrier protein] reductase
MIKEKFDLTGKIALVTGSTRGIGKAIALAFFKKGYRVCVTYSKDEKSAEEMRSLGVEVYKSDVRSEADVKTLFQTVGGVDILVNNAGVSLIKQIQDVSVEEFDDLFAVNVRGAFLCAREAAKKMIDKQSGLIVNISSVWGEVGASCESVYSASKAALIGFTKALAKELAPSKIPVNAIAFGVIDTDMNRCLSEEERVALAEEIPAGHFASPEAAASMLLRLANADAYLTGQVICYDGGFL